MPKEYRFIESIPQDFDYTLYANAIAANQAYDANSLLDHRTAKQTSFLCKYSGSGSFNLNFEGERTSAGTERFVLQTAVSISSSQVVTVTHGGCFIRAFLDGKSGSPTVTIYQKRV